MAYSWGWSEKKFLNSTPEYLYKSWFGKQRNEDKKRRDEYERLRILGAWILAPHSKGITPLKLMPLPWDEKKTSDVFLTENKELIPIWDMLEKQKWKP